MFCGIFPCAHHLQNIRRKCGHCAVRGSASNGMNILSRISGSRHIVQYCPDAGASFRPEWCSTALQSRARSVLQSTQTQQAIVLPPAMDTCVPVVELAPPRFDVDTQKQLA